MDARQLDVIIRLAGVTSMLALALLLARDGRGSRPAALFAPLAICLSGFLAGNTPDPLLRLAGVAGQAAHLLSGYAAVFIWWFCLAGFDRRFRLRGPVLAIGVVWIGVASADRGLFGAGMAGKGLSWLLVAFGFGMVAHLGWRLLRDREGDLIETRRDARVMVVVLLGGQLLVDLSVDLLLGLDWRPRIFAIGQNAAILAFTVWLAGKLLRADADALTFRTRQATPATAGKPSAQDARLVERLRHLVEVERVHLDPELSFARFVREMGAAERVVRRLINHELGYDHFRAFLNACRVEEACRLLSGDARTDDKLIAISFDSGFASLASFNRAFRAEKGCTPSQYRDAKRYGSLPASSAYAAKPTFEDRSVAY
jgi:AraC-like DNA-binding protein